MFMNWVHEQCPKNLTRENTESKRIENGLSAPSAQPAASSCAQAAPSAQPRPGRAPRARPRPAAPRAPTARPPPRSTPTRCCRLRPSAFHPSAPAPAVPAPCTPSTHARPAQRPPACRAPCLRAQPRAQHLPSALPLAQWAVAHFRVSTKIFFFFLNIIIFFFQLFPAVGKITKIIIIIIFFIFLDTQINFLKNLFYPIFFNCTTCKILEKLFSSSFFFSSVAFLATSRKF